MFRIESEAQLFECFRPLDRSEVKAPEGITYPLVVKDYFSWPEPSGHRMYLVFSESLRHPALGIVFRRDSDSSSMPHLCDWCHSTRSGNGVGLLTAAASDKRRVGVHLCRDLSCREMILARPENNEFAVRAVVQRMAEFARKQIF